MKIGTDKFLENPGLRSSDINMEDLVIVFTQEMNFGLEGEISSKEFFNTIAGYIRPIADDVNRIAMILKVALEQLWLH